MNLPTIGWFCKTISAHSDLDKNLGLGPISIDTRTLESDDTFWALRAGKDGHEFVETAFQKNAKAAVVAKEWFEKQRNQEYLYRCIVVDDTLKSLQESAAIWRRNLVCPVIGITGTNGKTSTKDLTIKLLSLRYKTQGTEGNFNNYIGLPLTILKTPQSAEILVLEMGASYPHEISELCQIAEPTYGLVTSIAKAHLEGFGSLEVVADTKGELYDSVAKKNIAFVPVEYPLCVEQASICDHKVGYSFAIKPQSWSSKFFQGVDLSFDEFGQGSFVFDSTHIKLINPGKAAAQSALAALSIAKVFEIPIDKCATIISEWQSVQGRTHIYKLNNFTLIDDSYNANPASMRASLELLKMMKTQRRVAVLGDMNELGAESEAEHISLGSDLKNYNLDLILFVGDQIRNTFEAAKSISKSYFFPTYQELLLSLNTLITPKDTVLVKASRSIKLEHIVNKLQEINS